MTPKEAFNNLFANSGKILGFDEMYVPINFLGKPKGLRDKLCKQVDEALTELERLRKKEMPMKPNEIELVDLEPSVGVCDCGKEVYSFENYCSSCGQKLDWSDEK